MAGRKRSAQIERLPDEQAERVAYILGPNSGIARALDECRARRAEGEDVHLWLTSTAILVGPSPALSRDGRGE